MKRTRRLAAFAFAVLFLVTMITSFLVVAFEANHDCIGDDCSVCAIIEVCRNTVKVLGSTLAAAACIAAFGRVSFASDPLLPALAASKTPVRLKVKFSN